MCNNTCSHSRDMDIYMLTEHLTKKGCISAFLHNKKKTNKLITMILDRWQTSKNNWSQKWNRQLTINSFCLRWVTYAIYDNMVFFKDIREKYSENNMFKLILMYMHNTLLGHCSNSLVTCQGTWYSFEILDLYRWHVWITKKTWIGFNSKAL